MSDVYEAAMAGNNDALQALIASGGDINWKRPASGWTPLMIAAGNGHLPCVETLLAAGVQVDATDLTQWTALHYAAGGNRPNIVRRLLASGANKAMKDNDGKTALDLARWERHAAVIALLDSSSPPTTMTEQIVVEEAAEAPRVMVSKSARSSWMPEQPRVNVASSEDTAPSPPMHVARSRSHVGSYLSAAPEPEPPAVAPEPYMPLYTNEELPSLSPAVEDPAFSTGALVTGEVVEEEKGEDGGREGPVCGEMIFKEQGRLCKVCFVPENKRLDAAKLQTLREQWDVASDGIASTCPRLKPPNVLIASDAGNVHPKAFAVMGVRGSAHTPCLPLPCLSRPRRWCSLSVYDRLAVDSRAAAARGTSFLQRILDRRQGAVGKGRRPERGRA